MAEQRRRIARRSVLKLTGSSLTTLGTTGLAAGEPGDGVRANVGFSGEAGRRATLDAATDVVRKFDSLDIVTVRVPERGASGLENRPDVDFVEKDATYRTCITSCGSCGRQSVIAPGCTYGSGADIAILDTGIQNDHPDLAQVLGSGAAFDFCSENECDFCDGSSCGCEYSNSDDNGHGTHVAGIVHDVAPYATLHAAKVLNSDGIGFASDIAGGIEWAANEGYDVVNMSFASGYTSTVHSACQYAQSHGVLLVAAAGNNYGGSVSYPAAHPECMAVSAVDCSDNWAPYSSEGTEVEITAPGSAIDSTHPCSACKSLSGTSMAAPHVAGGAAAVMAQGYDNDGARWRLKDTAVGIGLSERRQGYGRLSVQGATC